MNVSLSLLPRVRDRFLDVIAELRLSSALSSALAVALSAGFAGPITSQPSSRMAIVCDSTLRKLARGDNGYQSRGDRCEGLYARQVGEGGSLILVAIVRSDDDSLVNADKLRISWAQVGIDSIALVVRSTHPRIFYIMNTVRPGRGNAYDWPIDVARAEGLTPSDFGFLAWYPKSIRSDANRVYLPVQVSASGGPEPAGDFNVVVVPTTDLREVAVSADELQADGVVSRQLFHDRRLSGTYFPADTRIHIPLPSDRGQVLRLSIGALSTTGVPITLEIVVKSPQ
jgi:hypothetical protein